VSLNAPAIVRILWACTWSFGTRRQVVRLWIALGSHPVLVGLSNFRYACRNPWVFRMRRELRSAVATGRTVIFA
jgi:hypothetical protein